MKMINIRLIPNSKKKSVLKEGEGFKIHVTSPARENKANKELITLLADYFKVKATHITICKGMRSRKKVVKIVQ